MREGDAAFEALRAAIEDLAAEDAPGLLAEARAEARIKVRGILTEAIAQALLDQSSAALEAEHGPTTSAREAAPPPSQAPPPGTPAGPRAKEPPPTEAEAPAPPREAPPPASEAGVTAPSAGTAPESAGSGRYVYCVLDPRDFELPDGIEGVGGADALSLIGDGDIAALASEVPLSEFGEDRLRENLNDVEWLEATALAHERVLEAALARTTVIPMRLCTIYSSEESVREMLKHERAVFADALARLEGRTEWGVKVFVDRSALEGAVAERSSAVAALREEVEALPEGEAYMQRKRLDALAAEEAEVLVDECVDDVHGRLSELASEALLNPLQQPEVSGRSGEMLLNGVYLVEDSATDAFHAMVEELKVEHGKLGFGVELTGPWPPYNFVKSSIEAAR
jgi:hypothetical protein